MEVIVTVPAGIERVSVLGAGDRNLKMIREALGVDIAARGATVRISGPQDAATAARDVLVRLHQAATRGDDLSRPQVLDLINWAASRSGSEVSGPGGPGGALALDLSATGNLDAQLDGPAWGEALDVYASGRPVRPKTANQQLYLDAIRDHDMVFGIGPAGTGKTYLAVAAAVHMLKTARARKIILVRPAVEAGEKLGYLPGDMQAKVNPYLRPLFDALGDMMDFATVQRFMLSDVVEVVPLAFMRGRTLNRAVIILDEAQNTTRTQMLMFLTRMGHGSKMIVTGDPTQIDLPDPTQSGLIDAAHMLRKVKGIGFVYLMQEDIVRHTLVQRVVEAYGAEVVRRSENGRGRMKGRRAKDKGGMVDNQSGSSGDDRPAPESA